MAQRKDASISLYQFLTPLSVPPATVDSFIPSGICWHRHLTQSAASSLMALKWPEMKV